MAWRSNIGRKERTATEKTPSKFGLLLRCRSVGVGLASTPPRQRDRPKVLSQQQTHSMSNLVPWSFRNSSQPDVASPESASPSVSSPRPASAAPVIPQALYTECQTCRITGTATFSAVGVYALTVARSQAKTRVGQSVASAAGLGKSSAQYAWSTRADWLFTGFLAVAAARWSAYSPPPAEVEVGDSSQA